MNIQQLRQSLKQKWLSYYEQNIPWLVKMRIWGTYDGLRRPLSGFILATLSVLEPQFNEILSFMLELNNNPDKIVAALGLNFNPDEELRLIKLEYSMATSQVEEELRLIKSEHSLATSQAESESLDHKHSEDNMSSVVTGSKVAPDFLAKTLDSTSPRTDQLMPSFTATTEVVRTRKPELVVAFATKISPDTPVKTPSSGLLRKYQPVRWHSGQLPSGASATMTSQVKSKPKTMPSVALATEVKSNAPPGRIPVGASLAITTEINNNGKPVRSLAVTTEIKSNTKQPNIQPQDVSKVNLSTTNASSIASWVDEFCYGTRNKEEDILA
ncbi:MULTISPECIES: DUF5331 domain-containing protein [unclassified Nostoc]|uniref:DUF5331 domain-containing protein n=1 Tax=unclassified Nostoc TaxID=2593658 RepID=UPI002AD21B25|nr:DUF5331 domain-containing protein [Nostoc sp. DedQUE03]MDZ7975778.1 DUF5331 domain-containing protein [Nostoc sp. DedQUE03]MDZ8048311.1 DUF5331 domain-containing protein [Nostoc sp. DedQUE02]